MRRIAAAAACGLGLAAGAWAGGDWRFDLDGGVGALSGDATYEIGGKTTQDGMTEEGPFPISRLEWPMDVWMGRIAGTLAWRETLELRANFAFSLTDDAGTMEDSDWDYPGDGSRLLTVYSESDAALDASTWELDARWWFWQRNVRQADYAVGAGAGWIHQSFDWEARDGTQWYPADPGVPADTWDGAGITYALDSDVPYLQLAGRAKSGRFSIEGRVAYAPAITMNDRDDHLDRDILAETDADGDAWIAGISTEYAFENGWFARVGIQWMACSVDGPSKNHIYGPGEQGDNPVGERWAIHEEITSSQSFFAASVGRRF